MKKGTDLNKMLVSLDGQKYGAYKRAKGMYQFEQFRLAIDHVQVDPFAPPSKMRILISRQTAGIPNDLLDTQDKVTAVADRRLPGWQEPDRCRRDVRMSVGEGK